MEEWRDGRKRMKRNETTLGSDREVPVVATHSTVAAAPVHTRRRVRPAPDRSLAAGDEIVGGGGSRTIGYRDAAREVRHGTEDVLRGQRVGRYARGHLAVRVEAAGEHGALPDVARAIRARLHCRRKHGLVPSIHEVAVQPVASRVTVREHEPPAIAEPVVIPHGIPHLIEDGYEVVWMRGRALAVIDAIRVRHVGLMIGRVEVYTIPAAREEDLSSEAIRAIRVRESWCLRLRRAVEVNAKYAFGFA